MSKYHEVRIQVPSYSSERGTPHEFDEGARARARVDGTTTVIEANAAGLRSLARLLLTLAASDVPDGTHVHLDDFTGLLPGTTEVVIERAAVL